MNIVTRPHEKVWLAIFGPKRIDQSGYKTRRGQTLWYALLAAVLLGFEQFLIADRVPAHCFIAFLHNHWVGAAVFAGIIWHYYAL